MKRFIYQRLINWKEEKERKPLILRGARQVGKTHAVQMLGKTFPQFIEINFELAQKFCTIFEEDLDPERITREIYTLTKKNYSW